MILSKIAIYLEVSKPRVASLLIFSGAMSGLTALRMGLSKPSFLGLPFLDVFILTLIALTLGIFGTNAITCYIDKDIDSLMERTRKRPIPSGRIKPAVKALYYGLILSILALIVLSTLNLYAGIWSVFGLIDSAIIYNYLTKRKTSWNIILGAPAGGAPVLIVWSAITGQPFHFVPLLLAVSIVLWTPIHIWSLAIKYSKDYSSVGVPMLPVKIDFKKVARCMASTSLLFPVLSTLLGIVGGFQLVFYFVMYGLNAVIVFLAFKLILNPSHRNAWVLFKFTSPYLAVLLATTALIS